MTGSSLSHVLHSSRRRRQGPCTATKAARASRRQAPPHDPAKEHLLALDRIPPPCAAYPGAPSFARAHHNLIRYDLKDMNSHAACRAAAAWPWGPDARCALSHSPPSKIWTGHDCLLISFLHSRRRASLLQEGIDVHAGGASAAEAIRPRRRRCPGRGAWPSGATIVDQALHLGGVQAGGRTPGLAIEALRLRRQRQVRLGRGGNGRRGIALPGAVSAVMAISVSERGGTALEQRGTDERQRPERWP